jgi:protein-tyrosine phosphatase
MGRLLLFRDICKTEFRIPETQLPSLNHFDLQEGRNRRAVRRDSREELVGIIHSSWECSDNNVPSDSQFQKLALKKIRNFLFQECKRKNGQENLAKTKMENKNGTQRCKPKIQTS